MPIIALIIAADVSFVPTPPVIDETAWRDTLMKLFLENLSEEAMAKIRDRPGGDTDCVGGLNGVMCQGKDVISIFFYSVKGGNFNISALPNTVQRLSITSSQQTFEISTRSFPRDLRSINVTLNKIVGHIDLTTLPDPLETAEFHWNRLKGPIVLHKLPRKLRSINLRANPKIVQGTVYYDNLPNELTEIFLVYEWERKRIKEVRSINPDSPVRNPRIFKEMRPNSVH